MAISSRAARRLSPIAELRRLAPAKRAALRNAADVPPKLTLITHGEPPAAEALAAA